MKKNLSMTRNQIIEEIYNKAIPDSVWRYYRDSLFEDYKQEMYLLLLEMPEEKLFSLYKRGELEFYFIRMCRLQCLKHSWFFNKIFGKVELVQFNYDRYDNPGEE